MDKIYIKISDTKFKVVEPTEKAYDLVELNAERQKLVGSINELRAMGQRRLADLQVKIDEEQGKIDKIDADLVEAGKVGVGGTVVEPII